MIICALPPSETIGEVIETVELDFSHEMKYDVGKYGASDHAIGKFIKSFGT